VRRRFVCLHMYTYCVYIYVCLYVCMYVSDILDVSLHWMELAIRPELSERERKEEKREEKEKEEEEEKKEKEKEEEEGEEEKEQRRTNGTFTRKVRKCMRDGWLQTLGCALNMFAVAILSARGSRDERRREVCSNGEEKRGEGRRRESRGGDV